MKQKLVVEVLMGVQVECMEDALVAANALIFIDWGSVIKQEDGTWVLEGEYEVAPGMNLNVVTVEDEEEV